ASLPRPLHGKWRPTLGAGAHRRRPRKHRLQLLIGEEDPPAEEPVSPGDQLVGCEVADLPIQDVVHPDRRKQVLKRLEPDRRPEPRKAELLEGPVERVRPYRERVVEEMEIHSESTARLDDSKAEGCKIVALREFRGDL